MATPVIEKLLDEVHGAWRYRWAGLAAAWLVAVLGWLYVFALPDNYEAQSRVFVDTRTILRPALQGLAVNEDLNAEVNYVRQALLAGPQLLKVAQEAKMLPASGASPERQGAVLEMLGKNTKIDVKSASDREDDRNSGSIYRITYQDADRARALRVVDILSHALVTGTVYSTRVESESAQKFLETQLKDYEQRLQASEAKLAKFKSEHLGVMPTESGGYFAELQKESQAIEDTQNKLRTAESRRATLERQLRGDAAISGAGGIGLGGVGGGDTLSRIAETQAHLDELLLKYTDKHPDVIAARATLAELKQRRAAEVESLRRGDANAAAASRASTNPVYQGIALQLNQAEVDISDLKSELADHRAKAQELRAMLNTAPQVEAEFAQLSRDYTVNKDQYTTLLENYDKTRLGQRANDAGSVRFTVVQPPSVGQDPVWPNRPLFLAGVLILALGVGLGSAYGLNMLQPVAGSARALAALTGATVIGVVGDAFPARTTSTARRDRRRVYFAAACLVVTFGGVLLASNAGWRMPLPF
jgi:polysaccharide chain length determinant protein (PEP-CTERM system associated)